MQRNRTGKLSLLKAPETERIFRAIERSRKEMINLLTNLVAVRSLPGTRGEGEAQKIVEEQFREINGLKLDVWEPTQEEVERYPLHPIRLSKWDYRGRPNVVGALGQNEEEGHSLILNGHIDVVSAEPMESWKNDPWSGRLDGDRVFGRGTVDMKGGLVAIIFAAKAIVESGVEISGRLILESVVEEEFGGGGTISALLRGYKADAAIVAEGSGASNLCIGSNGSRFFKLRLLGNSEMPSRVDRGVDAIGLAMKMYRVLKKLDRSRLGRLRGKNPLFERSVSGALSAGARPVNLTIGTLRAGDWPATVAGWAELECRIGLAPSESGHDVEREFDEAIFNAAMKDRWMQKNPPRLTWFGARREPYQLKISEPIVTTVKKFIESVNNGPCNLFGTPAAADTAYFTPRVDGYGGIPSVIYGPGGRNIHGADEYVEVKDLLLAAKVMALTVLDWCGYEA